MGFLRALGFIFKLARNREREIFTVFFYNRFSAAFNDSSDRLSESVLMYVIKPPPLPSTPS